ncbi:ribosomal protein S18-alanine N-acetyltransferase [Clostridium lacusfryxellense]|uniref:ribosomal protein S18-alanine N-acetyltransferase n=1 Tax=Clostridium lacusfryxellense TaxID=205328 RepID=UPI001C0D2B55|nr:ribosomal protein S18-alanine N-acetyltransferase [Clostridium lacusfryxellense]MBU3112973.1 ribosomal protein S18-alanine N-acetyltransferase [Clostridium lacusfryxellense]
MINDFKIYPMDASSIKSILNISELSFPISWSYESLQSELDNKFAKYVVLKSGNSIIGYGGMWIIIDEAHVTNVAVHPDVRGQGAGDMIVEALFRICRKHKVCGITLEVRSSNFIALNLYQKYGFQQEGLRRNYYEDNGEDAVIMWNRNL